MPASALPPRRPCRLPLPYGGLKSRPISGLLPGGPAAYWRAAWCWLSLASLVAPGDFGPLLALGAPAPPRSVLPPGAVFFGLGGEGGLSAQVHAPR